jgi:hypothetical protein
MVPEFATDMDKQPGMDFAAQVPARSDRHGRKYAYKVVRNSASDRLAHSAASTHAPTRQKSVASKSGGITREHVEGIFLESVKDMVLEFATDMVQQPAKDFVMQLPTRSDNPGR